MRKATLFTVLCALALVLTACASANQAGNSTGTSGAAGSNSFRSGATWALSADAKLALGTIKLEGTAQAIDPKTAAKLLPLWQLMVQLHSSSSAAPQEVAAVVNQIRKTLTPAQLNAIDSMSFTTSDAFALLQSETQASSGSGSSSSNGSSGRSRAGGFAFGGPGPGFGGAPGGFAGGGEFRTTSGSGSSSTTQLTAAEQAQAAQERENAISSLVENQLIRLLETKLGSQPG